MSTLGDLTAQQRQAVIQSYLIGNGWAPPTSIALEKMRSEISDDIPANMQVSLQPLPAMANPFQGRSVGSIQQYQFGQQAPELSPAYQAALQSDRGLVRSSEELSNLALEVQSQYQVELVTSMPSNKLPTEQFLRSTFIEGKVLERIAPQLIFLDMATQFTTDSIDIVWFRHNFSPDTDPDLRDPIPIGEDGRFPRVTAGNPVKKMGSVGMWGFGMDFTRQALKHTNTAVDDIQRKIDWAAWKLANKINTIYGNVLTGGFSTVQTGLDAVLLEAADNSWDDVAANPFKDIRDLAFTMKTENGHYFAPSELWLTPAQWRELHDFADTVDHDWATRPINGQQTVNTFDNIAIREAPPNSGIPDGFGIMLARNTGPQFGLPLTVWEAVDPEFTRTGMMHVDQFRDPETKKVSVLMWKEFFVANRNPKAVGLIHSM